MSSAGGRGKQHIKSRGLVQFNRVVGKMLEEAVL